MDENEEVFDRLLLRLEPDFLDSSKRYKQFRLKMVKFFAWKRCEDPDSLADETINRVAKNLNAGEEIRADNPYSYIYAIAKYVFMEYLRDKKKRDVITSQLPDPEQVTIEGFSDCRKQCLDKLPPEKCRLLQQYYMDEKSREAMAQSLNISLNALRLQVHRLKNELRACNEDCLKHSS
jgi:RNA polymerase sigma factor (sigma-70 family)